MNHDLCGSSCHHGLGDGRSRGPTKAQQSAAAEEALARDIAQRVVAYLEGRPSRMGAWTMAVMGGRKIVDVKNVWSTPTSSVIQLRVNALFGAAPESVRNDVAFYFAMVLLREWGAGKGAAARFQAWASAAPPSKTYKRSGITVRPDGLDLQDIYDRLVATHIRGTDLERGVDWSVPRLTFGKRSKPSSRTVLGRYTLADKTITIHGNMMDDRWPGYVVADTMWHEMMHYWQHASGREMGHDALFRSLEKRFSGHSMANAWTAKNGDFIWRSGQHVEHPHR